jgi:hypothetical protein
MLSVIARRAQCIDDDTSVLSRYLLKGGPNHRHPVISIRYDRLADRRPGAVRVVLKAAHSTLPGSADSVDVDDIDSAHALCSPKQTNRSNTHHPFPIRLL